MVLRIGGGRTGDERAGYEGRGGEKRRFPHKRHSGEAIMSQYGEAWAKPHPIALI